MKPGSVIVDVAIDQGGCVETSKPTTHDNPTNVEEGVVHYCVSNMPGAVTRTSTHALANATFPYLFEIASKGIVNDAMTNSAIAKGINAAYGKITIKELADLFELPDHEVHDVLSHRK